jgi:hypothetical protein
MALPLNCLLLCASGAAYDIALDTGVYTPDPIFSPAVAYTSAPTAISLNQINACLVGQTAIGIIVAFRGTVPTSWVDWLNDVIAEPGSFAGLPGLVHTGFALAVQSVLAQVAAAVNGLKPGVGNPVYVTGHSKGGAMAPLAAYLLQQHNKIPIQQVVTFAAPRVGNGVFAAGYQAVFNNHVRYENYGDLAPLVPPTQAASGVLANAVSWIPEVGAELAKLFRDAGQWNYTSVGSEEYIDYDYSVIPNPPTVEQVGDLIWYLARNILDWETALGNAHSHYCGGGYMNGTCAGSGVCT